MSGSVHSASVLFTCFSDSVMASHSFQGNSAHLEEKKMRDQSRKKKKAHPTLPDISGLWPEHNQSCFQLPTKHRSQGPCPTVPDQSLSPVVIVGPGASSPPLLQSYKVVQINLHKGFGEMNEYFCFGWQSGPRV